MEIERFTVVPAPFETEIQSHVLFNAGHSMRMEIILNELQIGRRDPQRPHDLMGIGNKFEWQVIEGFSTENRPGIIQKEHVRESLARHRMQYHHLRWNHENSGATEDDLMAGAADAVCSRLEDRPYQGGIHTFDQIRKIIETNPPYQKHWMSVALEQIQKIPLPDIRQLTTLSRIPNLGVSQTTHETIVARVREAVTMLEQEHGYRNFDRF